MRPTASLLLLLFATSARADGPDPVRTAVVKGLRRIEQGSANYLKNRKCFSCHHQAVTIHCLAAAQKRGMEVDPAKLRQQIDFTLNTFKHKREQVAQGKAVPGGNTMAAYALFGLEAGGHAPDETTKALVEYLLVKQKPDGSWPAVMQRQPSEGSPFTNAAFALRALRTFRTADLQGASGQSVCPRPRLAVEGRTEGHRGPGFSPSRFGQRRGRSEANRCGPPGTPQGTTCRR